MAISRDEELRRFKQLRRLNFFYAVTVSIMTLILLLLMFNINVEQRRLIDETSVLVQQRAEVAEEQNRKAEQRLERSLERFEDLENLIMADRLEVLEENLLERLEELIREQR